MRVDMRFDRSFFAVAASVFYVLTTALATGAIGSVDAQTPPPARLTDAQLIRIREGFSRRRDQYLRGYLDQPFYEMPAAAAGQLLERADWIWRREGNPAVSAPVGTRYFRRVFTLPNDEEIGAASCAFAADNNFQLYVNGRKLGTGAGFHKAVVFDLQGRLRVGPNVLAIEAYNLGDAPNPAGVIGVVHIQLPRSEPLVIETDRRWQVSEKAQRGWQTDLTSKPSWTAALELAGAGAPPWGELVCDNSVLVTRYVFSRLTFALATLSRRIDTPTTDLLSIGSGRVAPDGARGEPTVMAQSARDRQIDLANQAIVEAVRKIRVTRRSVGEFGMHWTGGLFYRIYALFGPEGRGEHLLSDEASVGIGGLLADWARSQLRLSDADPKQVWRIWGSENHSAQRDATAWAAARVICAQPGGGDVRYADRSRAAEQLAAWRLFLKTYFRERIKRGMLVEISPAGYGSRTLQGWHNIYDFATDLELKRLAKAALDVWWADWAQEQLDGMRGGGKTRLYPGAGSLSHSDRNRAMSWFYLGRGQPAHHHETLALIATTTYRLPLVVMDIALDPTGRGEYACRSRRLGRHLDYRMSQSLSTAETPVYVVDSDYGGIFRYTYCTPDFVVGTLMLENRPLEYWTNISSQNRWHGVIFGGRADSTLYPRCLGDRNTYNEQWSIQNKGTLIAQKLRHSSPGTKQMRVYFSSDLQRHERHGWILVRAARAMAAVKVVVGGYQWEDENWLRCNDETTPVIFEIARSRDFDADLQQFETEIIKQSVEMSDGVLRYRGLRGSGDFTFYANRDRTPELNGQPIDFKPDETFDSPFMTERWADGIVRIAKEGRELVIDVRENR